MSEVTTGEIDAARRWAQSVASVSPYQRIISLCNALDARDATIAALREQIAGLEAERDTTQGSIRFLDAELRRRTAQRDAALAAISAPADEDTDA
jgi:hypothetical protein